VTAVLFNKKIPIADSRIAFGADCTQCTLNRQRLAISTCTTDTSGFLLSALSLFCGVSPAQEQRCFELGNTDISTQISEMIPTAANDWIPGTVETRLI
jgi:hypothetical protein